jgi:hypothetical protein
MYDEKRSREFDSAKPQRSYGIGPYVKARDAKHMTGNKGRTTAIRSSRQYSGLLN